MERLCQLVVLLLMLQANLSFCQEFNHAALAKLQESRFNGWGLAAINSWAHGVMKTDDGMIWITSADGVIRFDGKRFITMADPNKKYTFFRRIFKIDDTIYLGDMDKPLHYYDTSDSIPKISKVLWPQNLDGELNIWSSYEHQDGRLFLSDYKGIIYERTKEDQLDTLFVMPSNVVPGKSLSHTSRYIRPDPFDENKIWLCSIHGMFHVNVIDKSFKFYYPDDQYGLHIRIEEEGFTFYDHIQMGENIWISSFENGLIRFNTVDKTFKSFRYELPFDETAPATNVIRSHQQYDDQNIIIGGKALKIFNTVENKYFDFRRGHDDFDPPVLLAVETYKKDDEYYVISAGSVSKFSSDYNLFYSGKLSRINISDQIKYIIHAEKNANGDLIMTTNTGDRFMYSLADLLIEKLNTNDDQEVINNHSVVSSNGLNFVLDNNKVSIKDGNKEKNLELDDLTIIEGIQVDKNNHLWLKAKEGLIRYDLRNNSYRVYGQLDGLWNYVWSDPGIITSFDDGSMFASTGVTFAYFDPDDLLNEDSHRVLPYVYKLDVYNDTKVYNSDPNNKLETKLEPGDNYFSVHYSSQLDNPGQNIVYEYRLEGFDDQWIDAGVKNVASYSKVPPGDYNFLLRARYPGGKWSDVSDQLKIRLKPSFTETWYFKLLIALGFLGLLYLFYRLRTNFLLKEQQIKSEFQQQLSEAKLEALRSQMNPHFLFNSLNSIDNYILSNRPKEASEYLSKFSKLIRNILDFSKRKQINLSEEITTSKLYIEMEKMRFVNKFDYEIKVQDGLDLEQELVPPLIIQPYIENAIWHGLLHKEDRGMLSIGIERREQSLKITVDDDGIGRAKAIAIKSKSATKHKSHGMKITEARIRILNDLHELGGEVEIIDKHNDAGNSIGTQVKIILPSIIG